MINLDSIKVCLIKYKKAKVVFLIYYFETVKLKEICMRIQKHSKYKSCREFNNLLFIL